MRRKWTLLLFLPPFAAACLMFIGKGARSEIDTLQRMASGLELVAHEKGDGYEAWFYTGQVTPSVVEGRYETALKNRPGWIMPMSKVSAGTLYMNHYTPFLAPRWWQKPPIAVGHETRPFLDVNVMAGRAVRQDHDLGEGRGKWATVRIIAEDIANLSSPRRTAMAPFAGWTVSN